MALVCRRRERPRDPHAARGVPQDGRRLDRSNSFMHSFLAKGRLLYTHDDTIADLCARLHEHRRARYARCSCCARRRARCRPIYKAHKWLVTRGDLDYTALWILYAATSLARDRGHQRRPAGRPRGDSAGAGAQPGVLQDDLHRSAEHDEDAATACRPRWTPWTAISPSARAALFAPVLDYLREAGEARSAARSRRTSRGTSASSGVTTACEYLADQGLIGKASTPVRLTKKSNVEVQELAFFYLRAPDLITKRRWTRMEPVAKTSCLHELHGRSAQDAQTCSESQHRSHDGRRPGRARPQPQEHLGRDSPRPADRRHRTVGLGQVEPGVRHDLRRGAAALHGVALELCEAVRRAGGEARRGLRVRAVAGDLDRAEDAHQQPALDGRDDDRHRQLPESALRHDRRAALSAHRRADAEPDVQPDPRGDPVAARRHRDRAARAGLQGLRRGPRFRLHRGPQEGLPPADHRRQAGGPVRRGRARRIVGHGTWTPSSIGSSSAGSTRRRSRRGSPRRCSSATACCRCTSSRARARRRRSGSTQDVCSTTHHFVYGDIGPDYFMFNNPESACRTCGGLGVDKLTHPELLVPDPKRSILGGCFVPRSVQVQPGHLGRPGDVQPLQGARVSRSTRRGRTCPRSRAQRDPLRHRAEEGQADRRRRTRRSSATSGKASEVGFQRHRAAHRALLPALPPAGRSQLADGGVARQGDGRAHLPRLQRRARPRDAAAVHRRAARRCTTSGSSTSTSCTRFSARSSRRAAAPTPAGRC